jgi:cytochrome c-type biogenesis protein CcmF
MDENGKKEQVVLLNAVIEIEYAGKKSPVNMSMKISSDGAESTPVSYTTSDGKYNYVFQLASVIPDQNDKSKIRARIVVHKLFESGVGTKEETLIVEASVKPFINLVWLGTITLIVGFAVTIFRRAKNSIQEDQNGWM